MPNIKVVLWSAGSGAVIAFIAALFGRVGFFDLLLRSLIGGAAFALLGAGMSILLMRFIPELFELGEAEEEDFAVSSSGTDAGTESEGNAASRGNNLNIVLDGDEYNYASEEGSEDRGEETALSDSDVSGAELSDAEEVGESEDGEDEFVEEIEDPGQGEGAGDGSELQSSTHAQASAPQSNPQSQDSPQAKSGDSLSSGKTSSEYQEIEDLSDVDTLPDLEEFSDSFESVAASQESENGNNNGGGYSSNDSVDIMGDQQDPATVAKAVRTIIGKDQEG